MKRRWIVPRIKNLIQDSGLNEFTSSSVVQLWNQKYKNTVSSIQIGQILKINSSDFAHIGSQRSEFCSSQIHVWRLKEGVI